MALSPSDLAKYTALLAEAEDARHKLLLGQAAVRVQDQSGEAITYNTANMSRLVAYIAELKALIAGTTSPINSGPFRPVFL